MEQEPQPEDELIPLPIDGVLDLHTFKPRDVKDLVIDYLELCRARHILEVRIIHGKGIGELRRTVHTVLSRLSFVEGYGLATPLYGGEGATMVRLKPV
jgi:DNA-nicking Smr family endonuclease